MNPDTTTLSSFALALGCGLLIGVERERRKGSGPDRQFAGVRTFSLTALLGAGAQFLAQPGLLLAAGLLVAALSLASYWRDRSGDPGVTTEIALFVTFLLGVLAMHTPAVAAAGAVVVAILLAARIPLQRFSTQTLTEPELRSALVLAAAALIVLPLIPRQAISWLGGVNLYTVWQLVVLLMLVQSAGHVALRALGPRLGLPLSGLASGFVSSTATVAAMGARAREQPALTLACVSGALFSCVPTSLQLALVTLVVQPALLRSLAPSLVCAFVAALVAGIAALRRSQTPQTPLSDRPAFSLRQSVLLAVLLAGVTAAVAWAQAAYGTQAAYITSALAGFADVHSAAAAVLSLAAKDPSQSGMVLPAVLLAFSTNSVSKIIAAFAAGGWRYGVLAASGLVAIAVAVWLPYLLYL